MQLFYSNTNQDNFLFLDGEEAHHCVNVLRHQAGNRVNVTNGKGALFICEIVETSKKNVKLLILENQQSDLPQHLNLTIAIAPTKNIDRFEWFVEKATEIGVGRIIPFISKRSERKLIKPERIAKLAISAMKQSNHFYLPEIAELCSFDKMLEANENEINLIAHCINDDLNPISPYFNKDKSCIVCIGPEGDFMPDEVEKAIKNKFQAVSLGKSRLRTETAGIYACIAYHLGIDV